MPSSYESRDIVAVSATDDGYAMPLAVTIRSALDHLSPIRRLRLFILDGGLSEDNKQRLLNSWSDPRITVEWIRPDMELVHDLMVSYQVTVVTYLRLLMATVLPPDVSRAIYLDADMLVRRDLGDLWDEPQDEHAVLAVPDIAAPYIDAAASMPNFERCREFLCAYTPIANYHELGLPPDAPYFNGGLFVADIAYWRREKLAQQFLDCLRQNWKHVLWWDQYALNVVLARRWRPLDYRWNQGAHVYAFPNWRRSPVDRTTFSNLRRAPWIVHFCSPSKPWHYFNRHPFQSQWRRYIRATAWKNWRPPRPESFLHKWWDFHYQPLRSEWKSHVRALKRAVGYKRNRAA
jgi:lipopolysaccharide biosynthesis glycosyltransferase